MDAGSAQYVSHLVMNDHTWYRLITTADYVRAGLWCLSNLVIGISYLMLPVEIWHWRTALPFRSTAVIGALFVAFIAFCGISHLSMVVIMQTAPWWAVLLIYVPTAAVSLGTALLVRRERGLILAALQGVGAALAQGKE
ncbi:hypothetical protein FHS83_001051 [Rhizomicrobium palustre]|uniref:Ethylene receptor 1-like N-terminal domain-containing protein n=1 Tax=Rhizomicrobium palustre TaxID=189966 RepID=A0A846MWL3_9PROT|nr:hypothetical protein [Rhizomicrobium palustre]NIK87733.1 hypothetical protein [Rhizomicrobium palustre]